MTPERARDVERLCQAALEREPSARAAFLAHACGGDDAVRQEVESLLASESRAEGFLSTPALVFAGTVSGSGPTLVGQRLGPYEIVAPLGAGGMGAVYKARDTRVDRVVAIKVLRAEFSQRFQREAHAIAQLEHPHVCTLYDVGPNYLVMEYVEGTPLRGPLAPDKALTYAKQILDALEAAHRKQIVHRDLKPDNILVGKRGVKLLDFGLAHTARRNDDPTLTRPGDVMGTPGYISPEQWQGQPGDARSDLYAFGCVLYETLTGKRVTPERTPAEPPSMERIIRRCLAPDPNDRFQSAGDLKTVLDWTIEQPLTADPRPAPPTPWIAAAAAIVIVALLGAWAISRLSRPDVSGPVLRLQITPPEGGQPKRLGSAGDRKSRLVS